MSNAKFFKFKRTSFQLAVGVATIVALTACGGGGSSGGSSGTTGTKLTLAELREAISSTGSWQVVTTQDFVGSFPDLDNPMDLDTRFSSASVRTVNVESDDSLTVDECNLLGGETQTQAELLPNETLVDDEVKVICDYDIDYVKVDDTTFRIEETCDGEDYAEQTIKLLSTTPSFDNGSLSFTLSGGFSDLDTDEGVCGISVTNSTDRDYEDNTSVDDESVRDTELRIVAPYEGDQKIEVTMDMFDQVVTTDTYSVGNGNGSFLVRVRSEAFGSVGDPGTMVGVSGEVVITAVTEDTIAGTFSILLDNGSDFEGSFSLSLK